MATYQAVVAQTQSSSGSSNLCCSVATQTWSAHHVACSLLHTIHYASSMNAVWRTPIQPRPQTALLLLLLYIFSRTRMLLHFSLSLYFSHLCIFSTKNKLAKLKGLLRVQPNNRRKEEPQRGFISVIRYYEVQTVLVSLYFGLQTCVRQESSVICHLRFHQRLPTPPHPLLTHYKIHCLLLLSLH